MKNTKFLLALLMLGFLFVSCEKQQQEEWTHYYGYNIEEIAGTYTFSHVDDAFDGLTESVYCHICEDAKISVTAGSGGTIEFKLNCPSDDFNRTFEGLPRLTDNDFLISMTAPSWSPIYKLTVYVYKNNEGQIRFHGFARHVHNAGTVQEYPVNYYFDVIKN